MAGKFNLEDYDTVESRIKKFWEAYPDGRILTDVLHDSDQRKVVKAYIYADRLDDRAITSGLAEEIVGASMVTKTSALEVCETSAIGRALANFVFSGNKRPSREEMQKVERYEKGKANPVRTLTPDQTERLEKILEMLFEINEKDRLREIWKEEKDFLDVPVKGTTLKDALNKRVQDLS